jgi:hypothetical protein
MTPDDLTHIPREEKMSDHDERLADAFASRHFNRLNGSFESVEWLRIRAAYLDGMKAAREEMSGDDERDAYAWVTKENPDCESVEHWFYLQMRAFKAGRNGMVSASEIEKAVKAERERCAEIARMGYGDESEAVLRILNPGERDE